MMNLLETQWPISTSILNCIVSKFQSTSSWFMKKSCCTMIKVKLTNISQTKRTNQKEFLIKDTVRIGYAPCTSKIKSSSPKSTHNPKRSDHNFIPTITTYQNYVIHFAITDLYLIFTQLLNLSPSHGVLGFWGFGVLVRKKGAEIWIA